MLIMGMIANTKDILSLKCILSFRRFHIVAEGSRWSHDTARWAR